MEPGDHVDAAGAILLDAHGVEPIMLMGESGAGPAVVMELGGRINKTDERATHMYLASGAQVGELIARMVAAGRRVEPKLREEIEAAYTAEIERLHAEAT